MTKGLSCVIDCENYIYTYNDHSRSIFIILTCNINNKIKTIIVLNDHLKDSDKFHLLKLFIDIQMQDKAHVE